jgi:glutathione peroxidase
MSALLLASALLAAGVATHQGGAAQIARDAPSIYHFTMKDIDGKVVPLDKFKGKVLLVVNVASKCGLTPQYAGLQKLYTEYKDKGLVILGFPANEFRGQEPGTNEEIKKFCSATYGVTFPMFSKIAVKGDEIHPLYQWLIGNSDRPKEDIEWNFAKFVVGRDGKTIKRFAPKSTPDSPELVAAIKEALGASR